jgi:ABC-2 type transport system ATP-binding protein
MNPSVIVANLSKFYGRCSALHQVSFTVAPGSIYGLIGPNGAGKTTTLAIMAGLIWPTTGKVSLLGHQVEPNARVLASKVGFAAPRYSFFDYLTGAEILLACGLMHGLKAHEAQRRMCDLLLLLDLEGAAGHYLHQYSYGMRQKLSLACAMIHGPEVLLLDEPFLALDPTSVYRISRTLRQMSAGGRAIVLTSHDLSLVERLCHRVGILHEGRLKREIDLAPETGDHPVSATSRMALESALWEVVGKPEFQEPAWISNPGGNNAHIL